MLPLCWNQNQPCVLQVCFTAPPLQNNSGINIYRCSRGQQGFRENWLKLLFLIRPHSRLILAQSANNGTISMLNETGPVLFQQAHPCCSNSPGSQVRGGFFIFCCHKSLYRGLAFSYSKQVNLLYLLKEISVSLFSQLRKSSFRLKWDV